jgi:pyruvate/2-oxoglutarate/acetoin dehydrogenase E1 component
MQNRELTYVDAIRESMDQMLEADPSVFLIGEGVPDPKRIFGTTKGLAEKYGPDRVMDMPVAENGMTGILIGAAITGMKPVLVHQRIDFSLYAMDQVINNAAKWYSMYAGQKSCPLVIRMILGKGWGQGNQHSQNLQSLYAHIPGLKVVMPSSAYDAKGMMVAAIKDPNPVIFIEHRWLHNTTSHVPEELYEVPIGQSEVAKEGKDLTIVTWSYMKLETMKAVEFLEKEGISVEVIDIKSLSPLDYDTIQKSVAKTKKLLVVDASWKHNGFAGEIIARVAEDDSLSLTTHPKRITFPDYPSPSTPGLCQYYYAGMKEIYEKVHHMLDIPDMPEHSSVMEYDDSRIKDVPDKNFTGPF